MDIRHYFNAVDFSEFSGPNQKNWKYTLGASIEKNTSFLFPGTFDKLSVALIGVPFDSNLVENERCETPRHIREELYALAPFGKRVKIADFGDLKTASSVKGNYTAVRDIVEFLNEFGVVTIVIGGSQDLSCGISEAFKKTPYFSLTSVDALLDIKSGNELFGANNYLSRIFRGQPDIFQFNLLGYQRHYVPQQLFAKTKGINENRSLGQIQQNIKSTEPVFRNTDVVTFDMSSVKHIEAPGTRQVHPNGFKSEEACQLARYAGLSSRTKVFGLFEVDVQKEKTITTKLAAQILWYFLEGIANRYDDNPADSESNILYNVEIESMDGPITFVHNTVSNRWWMQVSNLKNETVYFACSAEEYIQAGNNEIPELWLKYTQKLDELLK